MCDPDLPLGRHTRIVHNGRFPKITFLILDCIHPNPRGGDWNKSLLQIELRWIHRLKATQPPGLNEAICFKPFLESFSSGGMEKQCQCQPIYTRYPVSPPVNQFLWGNLHIHTHLVRCVYMQLPTLIIMSYIIFCQCVVAYLLYLYSYVQISVYYLLKIFPNCILCVL